MKLSMVVIISYIVDCLHKKTFYEKLTKIICMKLNAQSKILYLVCLRVLTKHKVRYLNSSLLFLDK